MTFSILFRCLFYDGIAFCSGLFKDSCQFRRFEIYKFFYSNTVKISGEVSYPISMNYKKGETLSYYIKRAGGYGNKAKKDGVYAIYMNGAVEKISKRSSKAIEPGCEIVVPTKKQGKKMTSGEIVALTSGAASISSVIIAVISLIRK